MSFTLLTLREMFNDKEADKINKKLTGMRLHRTKCIQVYTENKDGIGTTLRLINKYDIDEAIQETSRLLKNSKPRYIESTKSFLSKLESIKISIDG
mgnify:FL=1